MARAPAVSAITTSAPASSRYDFGPPRPSTVTAPAATSRSAAARVPTPRLRGHEPIQPDTLMLGP